MVSSVKGYIASASDDDKDAFEHAAEIRRDSPIVTRVAAHLGLTESQLDEMFKLGETL
jgi:hypothetical protein